MTSAWLFNLGAEIYAAMNAQASWTESCARLAAYFPGHPSPTVLDLGCGPGFSAIALAQQRPDARIVGLDLAPRMLRVARQRVQQAGLESRIALLLADASRLPFPDTSLEVVTGHSFLYLVDRRSAVLAEIWRVLRPGGRLILMEPQAAPVPLARLLRHSRDPRFLFSVALWRPYSRHHGRFTPATLGATLEEAGFTSFGAEPVQAGLGLIGWATKPYTGS
jgi:ubiquinone/menaquinone biosynthesis C-methylase UbiE